MHILDLHFLGNERAISAFLLKTTEGPILIESGPYSTWSALTESLALHDVSPDQIRHVFLSHIHFDHAGAAWALARTGALIHVHPAGAMHLANPEKLYNSARMIYGERMDALWGAMEQIDPELIVQPAHNESVTIGQYTFTALHTPGHAVHHIAWLVTQIGSTEKTIFAGDVAGVKIDNGPVVPPCPPPDIQIEHWLQSIEILRNTAPDRLMLTHFGAINDVNLHLKELETVLHDWSEWMRPHHEAQTPQHEIVPLFETYVAASLGARGVTDAADLSRYAVANPAYMSVAGLMRYWKKKMHD
jgi:glyoxylase-like metal-dependent hydrolase (beta-lactamase superfamily II)